MSEESSLYTDEIKAQMRYVKWPKGLVVDVVEYPYGLTIRFYRDNFEQMDSDDKHYTVKTLGELIGKVRGMGCPCFFEVEEFLHG